MKKFWIAMALCLSFGVTMPSESNAASTTATSQAAKQVAKKSGAKKSAASKKYVPAYSIGDCYLGEAMYWQSEPVNVELTLYPNGKCEWKENGKLRGKGTFSGTITGKKYVVTVNIPNVGKYTFKGTKEHWSFDGPSESVTLDLEH